MRITDTRGKIIGYECDGCGNETYRHEAILPAHWHALDDRHYCADCDEYYTQPYGERIK